MSSKTIEGIRDMGALLEVVKERGAYNSVMWSDLRKPTDDEILDLLSKPCRHESQPTQLIVDQHGWLYDERSCAICGESLGWV